LIRCKNEMDRSHQPRRGEIQKPRATPWVGGSAKLRALKGRHTGREHSEKALPRNTSEAILSVGAAAWLCHRRQVWLSESRIFFYPLRRVFLLLVASSIVFCLACSKGHHGNAPPEADGGRTGDPRLVLTTAEIDSSLQKSAEQALGSNEGCIVVMDPSDGRIRALVNPRLAFEQAFPPGSAIKPFTALAAMRAGLIDVESRTACGERFTDDGFQIVCSHPKTGGPLSLSQALAYSCNFYFATLGKRLSPGPFNQILSEFGLGARTGAGSGREGAGQLPANFRVSFALGEGDGILVTPIQLLSAYSALIEGQRFRPHAAGGEHEIAPVSTVPIAGAQRSQLIDGMRGAVKYGTAHDSGLSSLPLYTYGKTGTSTTSAGFRTQGWFVGFAAGSRDSRDRPELAVLVFLKRTHGSECARAARDIFAIYSNVRQAEAGYVAASAEDSPSPEAPTVGSESAHERTVKVHLVTENITRTLGLENYVAGVVAGEAGIEPEPEALKAQAVVSRTFALKNLGRHSDEGYDFCSTTHCQRYMEPKNPSASARDAGAKTAGEVLRDQQGQLVDAYFHAACGGETANLTALWGPAAPGYLKGVRDDYCAAMPNYRWTQSVEANRLAEALRSDPRTDPGSRFEKAVVTKRDATGRAELITIEGAARRVVRGWDFKLIVGRSLGWNVLKSSRFEVAKVGTKFIFNGSGFGHGLGLCQQGGHVMARRGLSYRQIVSFYFPGTNCATVGENSQSEGSAGTDPPAIRGVQQGVLPAEIAAVTEYAAKTGAATEGRPYSIAARPRLSVIYAPPRTGGPLWPLSLAKRTLSSEHFRAAFGERVKTSDVESVLATLETARADLMRRLSAAAVEPREAAIVNVVIHETTSSFVSATGEPAWAAGATRGRTIELQPIDVLRRRGIIVATLRHEFAHCVMESIAASRIPRWLAEGAAIHFAGEGRLLAPFRPRQAISQEDLERQLEHPSSREQMRALYAAAYDQVLALIKKEGESSIWKRLAAFGRGTTPLLFGRRAPQAPTCKDFLRRGIVRDWLIRTFCVIHRPDDEPSAVLVSPHLQVAAPNSLSLASSLWCQGDLKAPSREC
jgi:stage II sporulation protein D